MGFIEWSWFIVLLPIWIVPMILVIPLSVGYILTKVGKLLEKEEKEEKKND